MSLPLPCIVCKRSFEHATPFNQSNQPCDGLAFHSRGAYGSTVFDPMDGSAIEVNICDACLLGAAGVGAVLEYPARRETRREWRPLASGIETGTAKSEALSAKHESPTAATSGGDAHNPKPSSMEAGG